MENIAEIDVGVLRVSSSKQGLVGDSPDEQREAIIVKRKMDGRENIPINWIELIQSASGEEQPFQKVLEMCDSPNIKVNRIYIRFIDRMTRGGAKSYIFFQEKLDGKNIQLVDVAGVISSEKQNSIGHIINKEYKWSVYRPSYQNEILEAEKAKEEVRKILTRMIGAEIRYTKMGYWTGPAPLGFISKKVDTLEHGKRVILVPDTNREAAWFEAMFTFRAQGLPDDENVAKVNAMSFITRPRNIYDKIQKNRIIGKHPGEQLTVKSLREYIKRPIYAGINTHSWLEGKAIKGRFKGIVSIDLFNRANKGKVKIVEHEDGTVRVYKGKIPAYLQKKDRFNPLFPWKEVVLCPMCKDTFYSSIPKKKKNGLRHASYHCKKGHTYYRIKMDDFDTTVEDFVKGIKFTDEFLLYLHKYILEEWEARRTVTLDVNVALTERLAAIEAEQKMIAEKIPMLSSVVTIKTLETKIEALEAEKENLMVEKSKKFKEGLDIQKIIRYSWHFFEHIEDLLLGGDNRRINATLFALVFDEKPTYEDLTFRTARLSCVFELNEQYKNSKNAISDPSNPQFEPSLAWLEQLRKVYDESGEDKQQNMV